MEEHCGKMFAKLKKKVAEEAAAAPRLGGTSRMPRSVSKESITSVGADSGDDFVSAHCCPHTLKNITQDILHSHKFPVLSGLSQDLGKREGGDDNF